MTRIAKAKLSRLESHYEVFAHNGIYLTLKELEMIDMTLLALPEHISVLEKLDEMIVGFNRAKHKNPELGYFYRGHISRVRKRIHRCTKISGRIVKSYESLQLAALDLGDIKMKSNISNCANGKIPSYKNWVWKWAD